MIAQLSHLRGPGGAACQLRAARRGDLRLGRGTPIFLDRRLEGAGLALFVLDAFLGRFGPLGILGRLHKPV